MNILHIIEQKSFYLFNQENILNIFEQNSQTAQNPSCKSHTNYKPKYKYMYVQNIGKIRNNIK